MRIFPKVTAALLAAAVVGIFASDVVYAGGHHGRVVSRQQTYYGCASHDYAGCHTGHSTGHHSGRGYRAYHH